MLPWDERIKSLTEKKILWLYIMIKRKEYLLNLHEIEKNKTLSHLYNPFLSFSQPDGLKYKAYNPYFEKDLEELKKAYGS